MKLISMYALNQSVRIAVCVLSMVVVGRADTLGYWHFEGSGAGFLADASGKGHTLVPEKAGSTPGDPKEYALPGKGIGATFASANNKSAAEFAVQDKSCLAAEPDAALNKQQFTIEALLSRPSARQDASGSVLVGLGAVAQTGGGWAVLVSNALSPRGVGHLLFQYQFAKGAWAGDTVFGVDSGIVLQDATDYYVAVAFNAADPSENGLVFYVKDLTNNGALQVVKMTHPGIALSVNESSDRFRIGGALNGFAKWDGIIDEVRLSDKQLPQAELLISARTNP